MFFIFIRTLPIIYSLVLFYLVVNLLSSAIFGELKIKTFFKRLLLAVIWPLTVMSPEGRKQLTYITRRL